MEALPVISHAGVRHAGHWAWFAARKTLHHDMKVGGRMPCHRRTNVVPFRSMDLAAPGPSKRKEMTFPEPAISMRS